MKTLEIKSASDSIRLDSQEQGIFGLYALTARDPVNPAATTVNVMELPLRMLFTIAAIGTGLSMTFMLTSLGLRESRPSDTPEIQQILRSQR